MKLLEGRQVIEVTVSLGGASHPELKESNEDALVRHVDAALYHAKEAGKNRTELCRHASLIMEQ